MYGAVSDITNIVTYFVIFYNEYFGGRQITFYSEMLQSNALEIT